MKNKKDRNYLILGLIGVILWTFGLVIFVALILNDPNQKAWVVGILIAFIIIGALLDFIFLLHYIVLFFKEQAKKEEEIKKKLNDTSAKDEDVHNLVEKILTDTKNKEL